MQAVCSHGTCLAAAVAPEKLQVVAACRREAGSCSLPPGPHASPWATANPPHPPCHRPVVQGARPAAGGRAGAGGSSLWREARGTESRGCCAFSGRKPSGCNSLGASVRPARKLPAPTLARVQASTSEAGREEVNGHRSSCGSPGPAQVPRLTC